jgi:hypothetical protein
LFGETGNGLRLSHLRYRPVDLKGSKARSMPSAVCRQIEKKSIRTP